MTLTATQLDALPVHSAVRCTTERGRTFLALKIDQGTGRHNPSRWNTTDGPATTTNVAAHNPVHLVPAAEPTTFTTPDDLRTWLYETDIVEPFSHLLRDAHQRPWIVTWSEDDPFVISYPEGDENGATPAAATYHGDLDLPVYPVRLIQEAGA